MAEATGAQNGSKTGEIDGVVTDPSGAVVQGARIAVLRRGRDIMSVSTSADGGYSLKNIPTDVYTIRISAGGFKTATSKLEVLPGKVTQRDVRLTIPSRRETVTVNSGDDEHGKNLGQIISGKGVDVLPDSPQLLGDELTSLATQTSGAGRPQIYVNGFPSDTIPPKSSIAEIQINQNPYSAEYGSAGTGRIDITTKAGTEVLHGEFSLAGSDSALDARNPLVEAKPSYFALASFGNLGGAINQHSSFFGDGGYENQQTVSIVSAEILNSQFSPVASNQVVPTGPTAIVTNPRLDLQLRKGLKLSILYSFSHQQTRNAMVGGLNLASQSVKLTSQGKTFQAGSTQVISGKALNEIAFQISGQTVDQAPASIAPTITVQGAFVGGGNNGGNSSNGTGGQRFRDTFSLEHGKQVIKVGAEAERNSNSANATAGFNGNFTFSSLGQYSMTLSGLAQGLTAQQIRENGGGASQFAITGGATRTLASMTQIAAFAEDAWSPSPNLSISTGLRIEGELGTYGHPDCAPRISINYGLDAKKGKPTRTRLMGGYGWSYEHFPLTDVLQLKTLNGTHQEQYLVAAPDFYPVVAPINSLATAISASSSIYRVNRGLRDSYTMQSTVGIMHDVNKIASLSLIYNNARSIDQILSPNINAPLPGTYNPADPTSGVRPFGSWTNIYQYESEGLTKQTSLATGLNIQAGTKFNFSASYRFTRANSDANGSPSNSYDLQADYGRISPTHSFDAVGHIALPFHLDLSSRTAISSGAPFNIVVGQDLNGDGVFNDRPTFATDLNRPSVVFTQWGVFDTDPIAQQKLIPFNYGRGARQVTQDLFLSNTLLFRSRKDTARTTEHTLNSNGAKSVAAEKERCRLQTSVSAGNVLNIVNLGPPVGVLGASLFGKSTSTSVPPRTLYLQTQLSF